MKIKKNIIIILEAVIFSIFLIFGSEINKNGYVEFSNFFMYIKIVFFSIIFSIIIYYFYKLLIRFENKEKNIENAVILKVKRKKYVFLTLLFIVFWTPLFLAVFPGYFCYDAISEYSIFVSGYLSTHHTILHTVLLGGIVQLGYLITNSYNFGIALYMCIQQIIAACVFSYTIFFMDKYNVSKKVKLIGILYYAFFPVIQMYVLNSSKDTLFTLATLMLIMCLIDLWKEPEIFLKNKKMIFKYILLVFLFCALRNNGIYAFIALCILFIFFPKKGRRKIFIINILTIILFKIIIEILIVMFNISEGSLVEMISVPLQQLGYVYNNEELSEEDKSDIESMFEEGWLEEKYSPYVSDPLKEALKVKTVLSEKKYYFQMYIRLFFKYPDDYINSFLINTVGFWAPNQIIDGYNKTPTYKNAYADSKTCYFYAITEGPGTRHSYIPLLENIFFKLSRDGIVENIPVICLLFSIGANFWLVIITICYNIYRKRYNIAIPLFLIIFIWGTVLLGPMVLVRYLLIVFFGAPLQLALLFNSKKFEEI